MPTRMRYRRMMLYRVISWGMGLGLIGLERAGICTPHLHFFLGWGGGRDPLALVVPYPVFSVYLFRHRSRLLSGASWPHEGYRNGKAGGNGGCFDLERYAV